MADSTDFELSSEDMRALGYRVVDMIVDHHQALPGKSATTVARRDALEALLREPPPRDGSDPEQVLATVERDVLSNIMYCTHPRHFAWVPGPGAASIARMGDKAAARRAMKAAGLIK